MSINNIPNMKKYSCLAPFKLWCATNFPFIEDNFDSLTNYELLCKITGYLNEIIKNENALKDNVTALYNAFIELENYVNNYFDNLDVQDEINKKLDDLVTDGTLANLINSTYYVENSNLIKGHNQVENTDYFIVHIPYKDLKNNVIKINHGFSNDNYQTTQPLETAREFSFRKNATAVINASPFFTSETPPYNNRIRGLLIHDGVVIQDTRSIDDDFYRMCYILGIKDDNTLKFYAPFTPAQDLIDDGVIDTITGFTPIMQNGQSLKDDLLANNHWDTPYAKSFIGQNTTTKDFYLLACNGKGTTEDLGLTNDEVIEIFQNIGVDFAYQLDGGGSTQLIYRMQMLNNKIDDVGFTERKVCDFIYFTKEYQENTITNNQIYYDKDLSNINNELKDLPNKTGLIKLKPLQDYQYPGIEVYQNGVDVRTEKVNLAPSFLQYLSTQLGVIFQTFQDGTITVSNLKHGYFPNSATRITKNTEMQLNNIDISTIVYSDMNVDNAPYDDCNAMILNICSTTATALDTKYQIAFGYGLSGQRKAIKTRNFNNNTWTPWVGVEMEDSGYNTITASQGTLYYRKIGKICEITGEFFGFNTTFSLQIPGIQLERQVTFLNAGGGTGTSTTFSKSWLDTTGKFWMAPGTGNEQTHYLVSHVFLTK